MGTGVENGVEGDNATKNGEEQPRVLVKNIGEEKAELELENLIMEDRHRLYIPPGDNLDPINQQQGVSTLKEGKYPVSEILQK